MSVLAAVFVDFRGYIHFLLTTPDLQGYSVDYCTSDACRVIYIYPYEENAGCREYLCTIIALVVAYLVH